MTTSLLPHQQRRFREELLSRFKKAPPAFRRAASRKSIRYFADTYLSHIFSEPWGSFHLRSLERIQNPENSRIVEAWPRYHGKSRIYSILVPIYYLTAGNKKSWVLISRTVKLTREWIHIIGRELATNELLINDWDIPPVDTWKAENAEEIRFDDGRLIQAKGRGYQIHGWHPDGVTVDDIDDDFTATSDIELDNTEKWFAGGLMPALRTYDPLYFVGTVISRRCLLNRTMAKIGAPRSRWVGELLEAWPDKPLWTSMWGKADLQAKLDELGLKRFSQEFGNRPMPDSGSLFPDVPIYPVPPDLTKCNLFMCVDWAATDKERNDQTAIVVAAMDVNRIIYVIDTYAAHMNPDKAVAAVVRMFDKWNTPEHPVLRLGVEQHVIGLVYGTLLKNWQLDTGRYLPVFPAMAGSKSKHARISPIQQRCQQGKFFIGEQHHELRMQLMEFGDTDRDDLSDATAYLEQTCYPPVLAASVEAEEAERKRMADEHGDLLKRFPEHKDGPVETDWAQVPEYQELVGVW